MVCVCVCMCDWVYVSLTPPPFCGSAAAIGGEERIQQILLKFWLKFNGIHQRYPSVGAPSENLKPDVWCSQILLRPFSFDQAACEQWKSDNFNKSIMRICHPISDLYGQKCLISVFHLQCIPDSYMCMCWWEKLKFGKARTSHLNSWKALPPPILPRDRLMSNQGGNMCARRGTFCWLQLTHAWREKTFFLRTMVRGAGWSSRGVIALHTKKRKSLRQKSPKIWKSKVKIENFFQVEYSKKKIFLPFWLSPLSLPREKNGREKR